MNAKSQTILKWFMWLLALSSAVVLGLILARIIPHPNLWVILYGFIAIGIAVAFSMKSYLFNLYHPKGKDRMDGAAILTVMFSAIYAVNGVMAGADALYLALLMLSSVVTGFVVAKYLDYMYQAEYLVMRVAQLKSHVYSLTEYKDYDDETRGYLIDLHQMLHNGCTDTQIMDTAEASLKEIDKATEELKKHKKVLCTTLHGKPLT